MFHSTVDVNNRRISDCNGSVINYTGQERFCPRRKMSFSCVFLDAEFKYFSRISLSRTPLAPGKWLESSAKGH